MNTLYALIEGLVLAALGVAVAFVLLMVAGPEDCFAWRPAGDEFARRWGGGCTGWTKPVALLHVVAGLMHWTAYVGTSRVVWRLHPVVRYTKWSKAKAFEEVARRNARLEQRARELGN